MTLIRILAVLQALALLPVLIRFVLLPPDFSAVGLWFFAVAVGGASLSYALWQFIRHPARRLWALSMIVLAVLTAGMPMAMAQFNIDPLPLPVAVISGVVMALIGSAWLLARPSLWDPERGWGAGRFNTVLLTLLTVWIALIATPLTAGLVVGYPPPLANHDDGLALDTILIHGASVGLAGLLLAVFGLLFSIIGLWRQRSLIHGLQLLASLLLSALLAVEAALISILIVNPG